MLSFELTEEQKQWQTKARDFAGGDAKLAAWEADQNPDFKHRFPWDIFKRMASEGLAWLRVPQQYGGTGLDLLTTILVIEELAAGDAGTAFTSMTCSVPPVAFAGTEEQKRKFLLPACNKEDPQLLAWGLTEAGAGSDVAGVMTRAKLEGNEYVLNGTKRFVTNGGIAAVYTFLARTDNGADRPSFSAFLTPADTKGLSMGKVENKSGCRTSHTSDMILDNIRLPKENIIGGEGKGLSIVMGIFDWERLMLGAIGVGVARTAYEAALNFSKERVKLSSVDQQIVSFTLADMITMIEASRLMAWRGCWLVDSGQPCGAEAAMTKILATDAAMKITTDAVQILGIHAYTKEYPAEKCMRDAKVFQVGGGTNQIQRLVVSRSLV